MFTLSALSSATPLVRRLILWPALVALITLACIGAIAIAPTVERVVTDNVNWGAAHLFAWTAHDDQGRDVEIAGDEVRELRSDPLPGFLYLEAPQVYTRERLVNDRFRQANWLESELQNSTKPEFRKALEQASVAEQHAVATNLQAAIGGDAMPATTDGDQTSSSPDLGEQALDQLETFGRLVTYRDQVRKELMDTLLDDGHDLAGNTLYRMNFDATVVPFFGARDPRSSAVFLFQVSQQPRTESENGKLGSLADDLELLRSWERELQVFLGKVLHHRTRTFKEAGGLDNPTDPKESLAFDWFLRVKVIEAFLDFLDDRVDILCYDDYDYVFSCPPSVASVSPSTHIELKKGARKGVLAKALGLEWRPDAPSPNILDDDLRRRFRDAIDRVRRIDEVREATSTYANQNFIIGEQAEEPCVQYSIRTGLARPVDAETIKGARQACSPPWSPDDSGQRALVRMISVLQELSAVLPQGQPRFQVILPTRGDGDKQVLDLLGLGFRPLVQSFAKFVPDSELLLAWQKAHEELRTSRQAQRDLLKWRKAQENLSEWQKIQKNDTELRQDQRNVAKSQNNQGAHSAWHLTQKVFFARKDAQDAVLEWRRVRAERSASQEANTTPLIFENIQKILFELEEVRNSDVPQNTVETSLVKLPDTSKCPHPGRTDSDEISKWFRDVGKGEDVGQAVDACLFRLARFLFLDHAASGAVADLFAEFVIVRLEKTHVPGYRPESPVSEYLSVDREGCQLTACRIAVGPRVDVTGFELAAAAWEHERNAEEKCLDELSVRGLIDALDVAHLVDTFSEPPGDATVVDIHAVGGSLKELGSCRSAECVAKYLRARLDGLNRIKIHTASAPSHSSNQTAEELAQRENQLEELLGRAWTPKARSRAVGAVNPAEAFAACRLARMLEDQHGGVAVYAVSPRSQTRVKTAAERKKWQAAVNAAIKAGDNTSAMRLQQAIEELADEVKAEPFVLGFSQMEGVSTQDGDGDELDVHAAPTSTTFGWAVRPRGGSASDAAFPPSHHRFSAVLSVPSWWKQVQVKVTACWVDANELRRLGRTLFDKPLSVCGAEHDPDGEPSAPTDPPLLRVGTNSPAGQNADGPALDKPFLSRTYPVPLPRRVEDVTARFKFEVVKHPYFDFEWKRELHKDPAAQLEVGRPGKLVLVGERLWRGTVVTLGNRPAERITVLPDMKGVVAEFECVEPPAGEEFSSLWPKAERSWVTRQAQSSGEAKPTGTGQLPTTVTVWTAEGRTESLGVRLLPFVARKPGDLPCTNTFSQAPSSPPTSSASAPAQSR